MFLLWLRQLPCCGDKTPASVPPPTNSRSSPTNTPIFPPTSFVLPTLFCVILYILFHWSGTPVCSQLVFCMHVCVWRCIPDVSEEKDVLHVHLFICHLVLPWSAFWLVLHSFIDLLNKTLSKTFNKTVFCQYIKQTRMKWKCLEMIV